MTDLITTTLQKLGERLAGRLSMPGDDRYAAATAIWAKPVGRPPRAVAHCRSPQDVQAAIRAARDADMPLSVRGGGHDWAGRALCEGIVIDLSPMRDADVDAGGGSAWIGGGARAADVVGATDPRGLALALGSVGEVGIAGLTLGGGYGPLIGRFGLALDNLLAAEVVLADGRIVAAKPGAEEELLWALRGGGGNFGVVTAMCHRLHPVPGVRSGMLIFPFAEARTVLERCVAIAAFAPEDLTVQFCFVYGEDGRPVVFVVPTWCGRPGEGEVRLAPLLHAGKLLVNSVAAKSYGASLRQFEGGFADGQRVFMETCSLPALDAASIEALIEAMETAVSPGCAIVTHEFKGYASRVPASATAFGLRRDHMLIEIIATFPDRSDEDEAQRHRQWAYATRRALDAAALPGGYPNLLVAEDADRVAASYGGNAERLVRAKRRYDPDNLFRSAIPLPVGREEGQRLRAAQR